MATINWINSSRSAEVLKRSCHLCGGQRLDFFEIQILTEERVKKGVLHGGLPTFQSASRDHCPGGGIIKRGQPQDVKYLVDPGQKKLQVVSYERWGDRTNELVQTYNKLIMREGHQ